MTWYFIAWSSFCYPRSCKVCNAQYCSICRNLETASPSTSLPPKGDLNVHLNQGPCARGEWSGAEKRLEKNFHSKCCEGRMNADCKCCSIYSHMMPHVWGGWNDFHFDLKKWDWGTLCQARDNKPLSKDTDPGSWHFKNIPKVVGWPPRSKHSPTCHMTCGKIWFSFPSTNLVNLDWGGSPYGLQVEEMELRLAEDGRSLVVPYFGDRVPWHQLSRSRSVKVSFQPKWACTFRWFNQRCLQTQRFMLAIVNTCQRDHQLPSKCSCVGWWFDSIISIVAHDYRVEVKQTSPGYKRMKVSRQRWRLLLDFAP